MVRPTNGLVKDVIMPSITIQGSSYGPRIENCYNQTRTKRKSLCSNRQYLSIPRRVCKNSGDPSSECDGGGGGE